MSRERCGLQRSLTNPLRRGRPSDTPEAALSGVLIAPTFDQDVKYGPILIDARHSQYRRLFIVSTTSSRNQLSPRHRGWRRCHSADTREEFAAPQAVGLVTDLDAALGEQLFDVATTRPALAANRYSTLSSRLVRCSSVVPPRTVCFEDVYLEPTDLDDWRERDRSTFASISAFVTSRISLPNGGLSSATRPSASGAPSSAPPSLQGRVDDECEPATSGIRTKSR
jgi:hypothetical protein